MPRVGKNDKLYDTLVLLKRHLRSCRQCQQARKAIAPDEMCGTGLMMTLKAADEYDSVIKLRIAAHSSVTGHVYACPDLSKHGKSYAVTAPALHVVAIQDTLS